MICHSTCKLVRLVSSASVLFVFITFVLSPKDVFAQSLFSGPVVGQMGNVQITASQINSLLVRSILTDPFALPVHLSSGFPVSTLATKLTSTLIFLCQ